MPITPSGRPGIFLETPDPRPASSQNQTKDDRDSNDAFVSVNNRALDQLQSIPSGRALLRQIEAITTMAPRKRVVLIFSDKWPGARPMNQKGDGTLVDCKGHFYEQRSTGDHFMPQAAAEVRPGHQTPGADEVQICTNPRSVAQFSPDDPARFEPDSTRYVVVLAHELIHARDQLHGITAPLGDVAGTFTHPGGWQTPKAELPDELRTIGVGPYAKEYPSENSVRKELGLALRPSYHGQTGEDLAPTSRKAPRASPKT